MFLYVRKISTPLRNGLVKRLETLRDEDGNLCDYGRILERFQRDAFDQSNQIRWGKTRQFTDLSAMIWQHLGDH